MKKSDYNRVMSLYKNAGVQAETCVQLIIQLSPNQAKAARAIMQFLRDISLFEFNQVQ
jgi:hypothetical protein